MSGRIDDGGSISPQDRALYRQEFKEGVNLFQNSLAEYQKADEVHKKNALKNVMDEALQVMNETAQLCLSKKAQMQENQLAQDYQAFSSLASPTDTDYQKLNSEIDNLKKDIG